MRLSTYIVIYLLYLFFNFFGFVFSELQTNFKDNNFLTLSFLDVGQGDSILIDTPNHKTILVDAGDNFETDVFLSRYFLFKPCRIDVVILTHDHKDHTFGAERLLKRCAAPTIFADFSTEFPSKTLHSGTHFKVGGVDFDVLWPPPGLEGSIDKNRESIVISMRYYDFNALLTGDVPGNVLCDLQKRTLNPAVDTPGILKVSHHGSRDGLCREINPKMAMISVGEGNKFKHPNAEVIDYYTSIGSQTYRTDLLGTIQFIYNPQTGSIKMRTL